MTERFDAVVIGGGQAGLATSCELTRAGVDHVVLERGRVGQTWRGRWDSFCLRTVRPAPRLSANTSSSSTSGATASPRGCPMVGSS